jgi:DNA-binding GntR family transcriptional regulator
MMMTFYDLPTNLLLTHDHSLKNIKELVGRVLLEHVTKNSPQHLLSQRDIALLAGLDWKAVHTALNSLMRDGVIKIERHRLFVNKESLREIFEF